MKTDTPMSEQMRDLIKKFPRRGALRIGVPQAINWADHAEGMEKILHETRKRLDALLSRDAFTPHVTLAIEEIAAKLRKEDWGS